MHYEASPWGVASKPPLYGTDDWGSKVLDPLTTSLTANTYANHEGKIRLFAEFCIDEEGTSPLECTEAVCVRYLARLTRGARERWRRLHAALLLCRQYLPASYRSE